MNRFKELLKYHFMVYMKSNKIIMPFLVWMICMYTVYSTSPISIVSDFIISMICLFYIMVWIGLAYIEIEDPVLEQLLILKVENENIYNISKTLFLAFIGIVMSLIGVVIPIIINIITGFQLFTRELTIIDISSAFILYSFIGLLGTVTGTLLHPRIMKNRKMAVIMTFTIALMSMIKGPMNTEIPSTCFITWIFPPLFNITQRFTGKEYFIMQDVVSVLLYISVYSSIIIFLQLYFLKRNKF
ncbi:hypothetical protein [Clostridium senegalense]|uniref:hypothetical protein n=1 Tax=Clostridium senegalense TaxID=1465809 RepID=UPI00028938D5|nr:hypothetical protein [Clostridium senegalense]